MLAVRARPRGRRARPRRRRDPRAGRLRRRRGRGLRGLGARARRPRCGAGVAALADADAVVVTLGDQPFITPQVITGALDQLGGLRRRAGDLRRRAGPPGRARPARDGRRRRARGRHRRARPAGALPRAHWEAGHLASATDIDTPEELARAMKLDLHSTWRHRSSRLARAQRPRGVAPCLPGATITGRDETAPTTASSRCGWARSRRSTGARSASMTPTRPRASATLAAGGTARPGRRERDDRQHAHRDATAAPASTPSPSSRSPARSRVRRQRRDRGRLQPPVAGLRHVPGRALGDPPAPTGAEVTAGEAAPEELLAAAPQDTPDPESASG